tara:strand:+ start:995 stop:1573 length:579 start_codon:yes stop_codon:yes gene_type:complete
MAGDALMWAAAAFAVAGVAVLRVSWGKPKRSTPLNIAGWAALVVALVVADSAAGEWGITVAILIATGAAFVALAIAGAKPVRKARARTVRTSHQGTDEMKSRPRSGLLTFAITGPLALAVSLLVALAVRALIVGAGGAEADGNVAVLATVPIVWPVLAFALLMMSARKAQLGWALGLAVLSAPFVFLQGGPV